jgi:hypothetical protein
LTIPLVLVLGFIWDFDNEDDVENKEAALIAEFSDRL